MSDIIEKNDSPEPSEASQVAAFGGEATGAAAVEVPSYMPRRTLGQLLRGDFRKESFSALQRSGIRKISIIVYTATNTR